MHTRFADLVIILSLPISKKEPYYQFERTKNGFRIFKFLFFSFSPSKTPCPRGWKMEAVSLNYLTFRSPIYNASIRGLVGKAQELCIARKKERINSLFVAITIHIKPSSQTNPILSLSQLSNSKLSYLLIHNKSFLLR